ncbi:hypothetical protein [Mitsuaria sp. 7]|uniref:hypothetical protein n=1 Tax=Mitsuaria sp. 7 TaxID=1658665 RepID=UPI0007DDBF11|nr:hypothetical protein [Mitsuaria sp. 7]ANH67312.1 hypothetical protein ABE85_06565 [Mitsuaria sp. 7]
MNLEIDVIDGRVTVDGKLVWQAGALGVAGLEGGPVRYLDLSAKLVIDARSGRAPAAFVLFDEEEFPESILTSRMVKRFVKKTGVEPEMAAQSRAVARFPWGEVEFYVDRRLGDLSIEVRG